VLKELYGYILAAISCGTDAEGHFHNPNVSDIVKSLITLIPILDLVSDYWLVITERSWESEDDLVVYAFYVFAFSQFIMIWGSNAW